MNSIKLDHQTQNFIYTTRLTSKQQAFVDSVVAGHNYIDAYKLAYDTKSSHKVMGISANALLKNPKIIKAIHTQRLELKKSMSIAIDKHNLQMHLASELKELYPKIQDEQTRIKVLEMLIAISIFNSV
jgi:phage terminase small subunit